MGAYYLKLVRELKINLPLIDPAHLIARFAALLEFGEETNKVVIDATRLVGRFSRDWMTHGRRPAGICGACLLLAARMNNFRRSIQEIVQVVKIGDETVKKRLGEFKATPSAALTMHDFRNVMLEEAADPPAFTRGLEKQKQEGREGKGKGSPSTGSRKRKRPRAEDADGLAEGPSAPEPPARQPIDMTQGIVSLGLDDPPIDQTGQPLFYPSDDEEQAAFNDIVNSQDKDEGGDVSPFLNGGEGNEKQEDSLGEDIAAEVSHFLNNSDGSEFITAIQDAEKQRTTRLSQLEVIDELQGLDEEELDAFLLTEEEVQKKTRMWVEFNRDYLERIASESLQVHPIYLCAYVRDRLYRFLVKGLDAEEGTENKRQKSRKVRFGVVPNFIIILINLSLQARKRQKPRDSTTASGETPAQSARALMKRKKTFSRRINYAAVEKLFAKPSPSQKSRTKSNAIEKEDEQDKYEENEKYEDDKDDEGVGHGDMDYYLDDGYQEEV